MHRHELSDEQWELVRTLLPSSPGGGRPPTDRRQIPSAVFWIVRTGAPWRDLPERYGPWQTVYHCFNQWRKDGTWQAILRALQVRLDRQGRIAWDLWCVDRSSVRASRAAAGAGKKGAQRNPPTTLWAAREAGSAANSTWLLTLAACPWSPKSRRDRTTNRRASNR